MYTYHTFNFFEYWNTKTNKKKRKGTVKCSQQYFACIKNEFKTDPVPWRGEKGLIPVGGRRWRGKRVGG
jgi:hypothetical protein